MSLELLKDECCVEILMIICTFINDVVVDCCFEWLMIAIELDIWRIV